MNAKTLGEARSLGTREDLIEFEGLTPQMVLALARDGVFDLQTFATCADWELAGGYTVVDGKRVKDEGVLEPFDVSLEEAQYLVMKARIELGLVNPEDLVTEAEGTGGEGGEEAEEEETA
jgi:N utilization substance protein A